MERRQRRSRFALPASATLLIRYIPVKLRSLGLLLLMVSACAREAPPPLSPFDRLLEARRSDYCSGVLAEALNDVRDGGTDWSSAELMRSLRWSFGHHHDNCGSSVNGVEMWRVSIEGLGRLGGDDSGRALVASLRVSHRPDVAPEDRSAGLAEMTDAALQALQDGSPWGANVLHELLTWYDENSSECSAEDFRDRVIAIIIGAGETGATALSEHFPPLIHEGACAPGWMLSEVLEEARPELQARVIARVTSIEEFEEDLPRLFNAVDSTSGPLRDALQIQACSLSVTLARRIFDDTDDDPRGAVTEVMAACSETLNGPARVVELQRRLTEWLVAHDEAEEALTVVEAVGVESVDDEWFTEVGTAVIAGRIDRSEHLQAVEMFDEVSSRIGIDDPRLEPLLEPLYGALIAATQQNLRERLVAEARVTLAQAERILGESDETQRLRVLVALMEVTTVAAEETCLDEEEMERIDDALSEARDLIRNSFREETSFRTLQTQAIRDWRTFTRSCRWRRRRR